MTPLEAAQRLAAHAPVADHDVGFGCQFCSGRAELPHDGAWQIEHKPDCPWLALPRIVAALEEDERRQPDKRCALCLSKVMSGIGTYPWTCGRGHTLRVDDGSLAALNRPPWSADA